jgi:phosphoribosylanthranilate isomerase
MPVRVKICGVTTPAEAVFAIDTGAEAVGLNFYPQSPRYLAATQAEAVCRALPPFASAVGVFVTTPDSEVIAAVRRCGLRAVQTYSAEPPDLSFAPAAFIPAFRVKEQADLLTIREFVRRATEAGRPAAAVLIDSFVPGEMGGTGHRAPWQMLAGFDPGVPLILAGGLTPDNVAEAIRQVRPWGVDVASGVEYAPGRKDPGKVRAFIQAAKGVS